MNYFLKFFVAVSALAILSLSLAKAEVSFSTLDNVKSMSEEEFYEYIRLTVVQQPEFSSAMAKQNEFNQNKKYAQRLRFPSINASLINDESLSRRVDDISSIRKRRDDSFDGVVTIEQPIYTGNEISSKIKKAKYGVDVAKEEFYAESSSLILTASQIYVETATSSILSKYVAEQLSLLTKYKDIAEKRFQSGAVDISEISAIAIKLSELEAKEAILGAKRLQTLEVFSSFFKEPYQNNGVPSILFTEITSDRDYQEKSNSYDQRIASLKIKGSESELAITKSSYRPKLGLSFRYTKYDIDDSGKDEDLRGGLTFSVPLFNFGRGSAEVGAAKSRVNQSKFMYARVMRDLEKQRANIFGAATGIIQARNKISDSLENIKSQQEILNLRIASSDFLILGIINATIQEINLLEQLLSAESQLFIYELQAAHINRRLLTQFNISF
jgi:adhesin transport system outer membrane protein